ncbi:MAG TPA: hypothetical protein VJK73_00175 [Candidatus Paceibacterota bacterium]
MVHLPKLLIGLVLIAVIAVFATHPRWFDPGRETGDEAGLTASSTDTSISSTTENGSGGVGGGGSGDDGGTSTVSGKSITLSLIFGGIQRSYILHIPTGYTTSKKYPLMISFHGNGGSGLGQELKTGFDAVADASGFFIAYPDAVSGTWQLAGRTNDIDFAQSLLTAIESNYSIDASRIYASGFSQGGGVAQGLTCTVPNKIAGMAVVSENLSQKMAGLCNPTVPVTAVFFHGTADPVSLYEGGNYKGGNTYSSLQTAEFWVKANGCSSSPDTMPFADTLSDGSRVTNTKQVWTGCGGGVTVTFYTIEGGGHAWPGGTPSKKTEVGPRSTGVNASQVIWNTLSSMRR